MERKVFVTGIWHETNGFADRPTGIADFRAYQYAEGGAMVASLAGTNTEIGGMLDAAPEQGLELAFGLYAGAVPSGTVAHGAFDLLVGATLERLQAERPVAGVLLALHGAMVVEGIPDADAEVAQRVRQVVGPDVPVVATFDIHANLSPALVEATDLLVGYDTYPHTDMAERGREAATLLARMMATGERPGKAFRKLPFLTAPQTQATDDPPMRGLIRALQDEEQGSGIWSGSIAIGFPYVDVAQLGVGVVVYGDGASAAEAGDRLASRVWAARGSFVPTLVPPDEAVRNALSAPGPIVLVDPADNVGGGAPGDGTVILEALMKAGATGAVIVLHAPEAAARCVASGLGADFQSRVGGSDGRHGSPIEVGGRIVFAAPVSYRRRSSYMTGQLVDLGDCAVIDAGGIRVVLTSRRAMPFDGDHLRAVGIAPEDQQVLVCKSAIGWRAAFGDCARSHVFVDTPGITGSDLTRFTYRCGGQSMWPIDRTAGYPS